ncbi:MAG: sugar ABC transporter substrate-binding protein [Candidatus Bathyarchaeia archaeon]
MGEEEKKEEAVSRRKYLGAIGGLAAAAVVGWGVAGYLASKPPAPAIEKTVTETKTITVTPAVTTPVKKYKWGLSPYYIDDDWYRVEVMGAQYYAEDRGYELLVFNPHGNIETQIKDIRHMVSALKIDGLVVTPCDLVVIIDTLEWVHDQGIPIIATFYDVDTSVVDLSIISDFSLIGKAMAEEMIKAAQKDGVKIEGPLFIVTGPSVDYQSKSLTNAQKSVFENYPDLKPIVLECPAWGTDEAIKNVVDGYHGYGKPFGIIGNNMTTSIGVVEGMKTAGIAVPRGSKGHIYTSTFDGAEAIWDYMEAGLIDCFADIPNPHIDSLAQDLLGIIKEKGVEGLPPVGAKVISDWSKPEGPQPDGSWNILLHGKEHKGVNPFKVAPWAPAEMIIYEGLHRRLNCPAAIVTPEKLADYKLISWVSLVKAWLG